MQPDNGIIKLTTDLIIPNKYQPRKVFDDKALNSLAESIKTYGIINPILVRKKDDKYEIIAGERRFRAAKQVGLTEVPVIIKNADEQQMAELALIENIQRQGLSPIEEAKSYEEIMKIGNQTQSSLAEKLGKSQSSIANKIRLLTLPNEVQEALSHKKISERHARSLINIDNKEKQLEILDRIIKEKLTVKETEQLINEKEITEQEIKQAISDIMKSINIIEEEEKEEKEDDNMNNGNFFPSFDNNNLANNNTSLNMMNMQSMNQVPVTAAPEVVMPTKSTPAYESQMTIPQGPVESPIMQQMNIVPQNDFNQFSTPTVPDQNMNNQPNNIQQPENYGAAQVMSDAPIFTPQYTETILPEPPQMVSQEAPTMVQPMVDTPLFNPEVIMPEQSPVAPMGFDVPVTTNEAQLPPVVDRFAELQNLLNTNGFNYKVYSNESDNCVIIELPKN